MQGTGLSVAELLLMFQYVACRINTIPYGIKNKYSYILRGNELLIFICPADWMMYQAPNSLDFTSFENSRGQAIKSTVDKLETMEEFRKEEFMKLLNKQYSNVCLKNPKRIKVNLIVLVRNIANEPKREPLKLARIEKIHDSRDNTQRVVTLTYHSVEHNKDGDWIGTPERVDRSINDLVLVDNALYESMLNPSIIKEKNPLENNEKKEEMNQEKDKNDEIRYAESENNENNGIRNDENNRLEKDDSENDENDENDDSRNDENDESGNNENDENDKTRNDEVRINESSDRDENLQGVRR